MVTAVEQGDSMMGSGMAGMVGGMIGSDSALIGFILHVIISAVIGALYTGLFMQYVNLENPLYNIAIGGLIYGVIWWILGGLIIMRQLSGKRTCCRLTSMIRACWVISCLVTRLRSSSSFATPPWAWVTNSLAFGKPIFAVAGPRNSIAGSFFV